MDKALPPKASRSCLGTTSHPAPRENSCSSRSRSQARWGRAGAMDLAADGRDRPLRWRPLATVVGQPWPPAARRPAANGARSSRCLEAGRNGASSCPLR